MTDPLGQSQVISYLVLLSKLGYSFTLLSYEKESRYAQEKDVVNGFIADEDINWVPLKYRNRPPIISTLIALREGRRKIELLEQSGGPFEVVHCRGYISSILGRWLKRRSGTPFFFDMRGWWPDEKHESGHWSSILYKPVYRYFKSLEKKFFEESDLALSLTHVGRAAIAELGLKDADHVGVIPTCVNFSVFPEFDASIRSVVREELGIPDDAIVMLYSGSVGGNYRTDLVLEFYRQLIKLKGDKAWMVFLSHSPRGVIEEAIIEANLTQDRIVITGTTYPNVHRYLMSADVGVIMYSTDFSVIGRSPTKLGEYWSAGLKVLSASGIGDLDMIMEKHPKGGILLEDLENLDSYEEAVELVLGLDTSRAQLYSYAVDYFDIENGVQLYHQLYERILGDV